MTQPAKRPLATGMAASISRRFSAADITELHRISGAPDTPDQVPEALINGLFSYLLGVELPGPGTNYLKQDTRFLAAASTGDTLTARVEITRLRPDKHLVDLATICTAQSGEVIAEGRALVLARDVEHAFA